MPKLKGFKNPSKVDYFSLNVSMLDARFKDGETVDAKSLVEKGILKKEAPVKLLGNGELTKKLTVKVNLASKSAVEKVEKAGGKMDLLGAVSTKQPKEETKES
jgi:large subunit ribosomal protein L15